VNEIEQLKEVWEITAWKDGAVYKTRNTGETRWMTSDEVKANHPAETNVIFVNMSTSYTGQTTRVRKR
jgi:hypothetical protein